MPRPQATHLRLALLTTAAILSTGLLPHQTLTLKSQQLAQAHTVEIAEDIGATLHIEPSDSPRAGEEVLAWFALTRKGGQTVPLSECNCTLTISSANEANLNPPLAEIDAEGYEDIPGARFTFPAVGQYTLSLSGSPKEAEDFEPFTLSFDVTVAAGKATPARSGNSSTETIEPQSEIQSEALPKTQSETRSTENTATQSPLTKLIWPGIFGIILLGGTIGFLRNKQKP